MISTQWGWMTHIWVPNLAIIGSVNGYSAPSHYPNQCWNIVNSTPRNNFQWNFNQNSYISIRENAFQNAICKMAHILSQLQCFNEGYRYQSSWKPNFSWPDTLRYWGLNKNGYHFVGDIFKCIFLENICCMLVQISLDFVHKVQLTVSQHWYGLALNRAMSLPEPVMAQSTNAYLWH